MTREIEIAKDVIKGKMQMVLYCMEQKVDKEAIQMHKDELRGMLIMLKSISGTFYAIHTYFDSIDFGHYEKSGKWVSEYKISK